MYKKLRRHLYTEYGHKKLNIKTKVYVKKDMSIDGIELVIERDNPRYRSLIYSNWYIWDCHKLEANVLPDDVIAEIDTIRQHIETKWNSLLSTK